MNNKYFCTERIFKSIIAMQLRPLFFVGFLFQIVIIVKIEIFEVNFPYLI